MLLSNKELSNQSVLSLQIGGPIGRVKRAIVDPKDLTILALELDNGWLEKERSFILSDSVREHHKIGLVVDSADEIVGYDDVIKLQKLLDQQFDLLNLKVYTEAGKFIGVIIEFTIVYNLFLIYQIYVKKTNWKNFFGEDLIIDRNMIVDVTNDKLIIKDEFEKIKQKNAFVQQQFFNPFRKNNKKVVCIEK